MSLSIPKFILNAFAKNGLKNAIPESANQVTGDAGYIEGFPPVTFIPKIAGGIPPKGMDFNGILYEITDALRYVQAGRSFPYNQEFAVAIGGYGKGSLVSVESDLSAVYKSKIDNNLTPPPSADWELPGSTPQATELIAGISKVATSAVLSAGVNNDSFATAKGIKDAGLWPLGVGQTWQDVTASRASGTIYTNTTGRTIKILGISASGIRIHVDGKDLGTKYYSGSSGSVSNSELVPPNSTYKITATDALLQKFWELR